MTPALELAVLVATARQRNAAAYLLDAGHRDEAVLRLESETVPVRHLHGLQAYARSVPWWAAVTRSRMRSGVTAAVKSVAQELYVELRRQTGDERLPAKVRDRLKRWTQNLFAVASAPARTEPSFPRRLLREPMRMSLPPQLSSDLARQAALLGIEGGTPLVAFAFQSRPALFADAIRFLQAHRYTVARVGPAIAGPVRHLGVVDLAGDAGENDLLQLYALGTCRFVVSEIRDVDALALAIGKPCLRVNVTDAIVEYPIRAGDAFVVATPIDLDSGARYGPRDLLGEGYYRNRRNCGFQSAPAADLLAAVAEMHEAEEGRWVETAAQTRFRAAATSAADALRHLPALSGRAADDGFLGDGRLAAVQAERAA